MIFMSDAHGPVVDCKPGQIMAQFFAIRGELTTVLVSKCKDRCAEWHTLSTHLPYLQQLQFKQHVRAQLLNQYL